MKILFINLRVDSGSVGRIVSDLYHEAKNEGFECKIAYGKGATGSIDINDLYRIGTKKDLYIHALCSRLFGATGTYSKKATQNLIEKIEKFKPDIVHMHGNYGYYINIEVLFNYLSKNNIKVISTLHSCWDFTGHCCYYSEIDCKQWIDGCKNCTQKKDYPEAYLFEDVDKNYRLKKKLYDKLKYCTIVGPCKWMQQQAEWSFLKKHNIVTIYNGIDRAVFKPNYIKPNYIKPQYLDDKKINILCVANNWDRRKGLADVIELSQLINNKYQLIVVGLKKGQFKLFPNSVITLERTKSIDELTALYTSSDVLFNPTYDDNYPTVNLEAIACHTPVVTYMTGGSPDALQNGKYGIVIGHKEFMKLLSYAEDIKNKRKVIDFSDLSFLDKRNMIREYIDLYKRISLKNV